MPINAKDWALLIGVSGYPILGLQEGQLAPRDLDGVKADLDAMRAWLLNKKGGGVPRVRTH